MRLLLKLISLVVPLFAVKAGASDLASASISSGRQTSTQLVGDLSCAPERNYFQSDLQNLQYSKTKTISGFLLRIKPLEAPIMDYRCVESSLANVRAGGINKETGRFVGNDFNRCYVNGQGKLVLLDRQKEPCATAHYSKLTHHSYELVMSCLKGYVSGSRDTNIQNDWAETYFKFLTKESGLQTNVVSHEGAVGVGQLTTGYIIHFAKETLDDVRDHLAKSPRGYCRTLGAEMLTQEKIEKINYTQYYDKKKGKWKNRGFKDKDEAEIAATRSKCTMMDINEGEPLTNLIISFAHLKVFKEQVEDILRERNSIFQSLSAKDYAILLQKLTTLSYNTGVRGLSSELRAVMSQYSKREPVLHVDSFLKVLSRSFAPKGDRDTRRNREMANYLSNIENRFDDVMKDAGVRSCRVAN